MTAPIKMCSQCERALPSSDFYRNSAKRGGLSSECRPCHRARNKANHEKNRERALARMAAYRMAYPERVKASDAAWQESHPEQIAASRAAYRETRMEACRLMWRAHHAVSSALRRGVLVRPAACEECGASNIGIVGAHRDYEPPYLNVRWLCQRCHVRWDKAHPKLLGRHDMAV